MAKLQAELLSTKMIFQNQRHVKFIIPSFQRRFVWTRDNVKDMFEDFNEDSNNYSFKSTSELDGYLLGSIVLIDLENGDKYEVVDGQQRLTTLTLVYKSIANRYKKLSKEYPDNEEYALLRASVREFYYSDLTGNTLKLNPNPHLSYYKTYKDIIDDSYDSSKEVSSSIDDNIYDVWDEINNQVDELSLDKLRKFYDYLQDNVMIIKIVCPSEDQAFQLFEVLNNRGQSLEPLDLIKNMLLQKVNDNKEVAKFDLYWKNFSENMYIRKNRKGKVSNYSSSFLKYFIMSEYGKNVRQNKLVTFFKSQFSYDKINSQNSVSIVKKLSNYSDIYKNMIECPKSNVFSNSPLMYSLSLLDIKQFHQLFMLFYFNETVDQDELQRIREKIIMACIKMGISTVYNHDLPGEIGKAIPNIVNMFYSELEHGKNLSEAADSMINIIDQYNKRKYNELSLTLSSRALSNKKALNLFRIIEIVINENNGIMSKQGKDRSITLEHIMPQNTPINLESLGFSEDDNYDEIINTIGNLTLLHKNDNSALKDKPFSIKRDAYGKNDLLVTKAIAGKFISISKSGYNADKINQLTKYYETSFYNENLWNKNCIEERGSELSRLITDFIVNKI